MSASFDNRARALMERIRWQIFTPDVTTWGMCSRVCGRPARGNGICATCTGHELSLMLRSRGGMNYHKACVAQRECELSILRKAEKMDAKGEAA